MGILLALLVPEVGTRVGFLSMVFIYTCAVQCGGQQSHVAFKFKVIKIR